MPAKSVSPEQQRIAELQHALEVAVTTVLRIHAALRIKSIEADEIAWAFLCNHDLDPSSKRGKALLKRCPEAYHHELEKAVKRTVGK